MTVVNVTALLCYGLFHVIYSYFPRSEIYRGFIYFLNEQTPIGPQD